LKKLSTKRKISLGFMVGAVLVSLVILVDTFTEALPYLASQGLRLLFIVLMGIGLALLVVDSKKRPE